MMPQMARNKWYALLSAGVSIMCFAVVISAVHTAVWCTARSTADVFSRLSFYLGGGMGASAAIAFTMGIAFAMLAIRLGTSGSRRRTVVAALILVGVLVVLVLAVAYLILLSDPVLRDLSSGGLKPVGVAE